MEEMRAIRALLPLVWLATPVSVSALYNPSIGQWLNRDPIEERGGISLVGFVNNDPIQKADKLGKSIWGGERICCCGDKIISGNDRDSFWKRWGASRFGLIQSLGATAPIEQNGRFAIICFHVLPYDGDVTVSGLTVTNPFRGKVGDKLSFKNGLVRREDVELQFGQIDHVITILSDGIVLARDGKPFLFRAPGGGETLYYRHKGINFDLRSNTVTGFWVYSVANSGTAETR